jgi:hypothetical protein
MFGQINLRIYLVLLSILFCDNLLLAQCSITSSTGYLVDVNVMPRSIVAPSSCPYGYNYNVIIDYTVTYSGSGAPGSMYTLQGNLTCGSHSLFYNLPLSGGTGSYTTTANPYRNTTDCATATPASLGCNSSTLQIEGPGISNRTITCTGSALPIELIEFKTIKTVNEVLIKWVTASETNNDYFTIERSNDGEDWKIIGTASGAGNSNQNNEYTFIDRNPLKGNSYYQLRQTDYDGTTTYSYISSVDESKVSSPIVLEVYPNPSENMITIEGEENALNEIFIYSMLGKNYTLETSFNHLSETMIQCDISSLPNGVYFLQSTKGTKRFVKI